jgi:hypothetical protein
LPAKPATSVERPPAASGGTPHPAASECDGYSRGIEKFAQAAAARPQMIVGPRSTRQLVVLTCAFGAAIVRVAFNENDQPYIALPAAGTWEWVLGPDEVLMCTTTIDTFVTGAARDLRGS